MALCSNLLAAMRLERYLLIVASLLCSCGKEEPSNAQASKQPEASKAVLPPTTSDVPQASKPIEPFVPGDSVPPMESLGEGKFSPRGLADAFQHATGWAMPDYVKPVDGGYRVWNEKDFGGRNRASYGAYYTVPPQRINDLADLVEKAWREKYGGNPEIELSRSVCEKTYGSADKIIHAGTIGLGLNEKYASYSLLKFTVGLDPVSGTVSVTSYRGTEDTPAEREKPDAQ
jgi:hypothetical protein